MDSNFFARLQVLSSLSEETTIEKSRKELQKIVDFFKEQEDYLENVTIFAEKVRNLSVQTLLDCDSFMVQDDFPLAKIPEELQHESYGFCRNGYITYSGRYVYPVKDVHGQVMGFCGYDKFEDTKYLDSTNYGYRAKTYCMWGMEKLPIYYRNKDLVFFVEGIVCALYLRQEECQSLAMLGSQVSSYCCEIIRRFGNRAVVICDSDEAGTKCRSLLRRKCPMARCIQSTVAKDVDDSRQADPEFVTELKKLTNPFYQSKLFH